MIYENCTIHGPFKRKKDGRLHIIIIFPNGKRRLKSYPNYLMELKLGRYLEKDETVDHLDMDIDNNDFSNLVIKSRSQHVKDDGKRLKPQTFVCPMCKMEFKAESTKLSRIIQNRKKGKPGPFCSKSCSGRYGAMIQNNQMETLPVQEIERKYYNLKGFEFDFKPMNRNPNSNIFNPNRKYTDEEIIEIRLKYINKELTLEEIEQKYDLKRKTVKNILSGKSYSNLPYTSKIEKSDYFKSDSETVLKWKKLREEGYSYHEIGRMFEVNHTTIMYQLNKVLP